jgi:undecaprenyl-diphosphatase
LITAWFGSISARKWDVSADSRLAWLILLGTIPAGLAGLALESTAEDAFRDPALVAAMLILFSIPMVLAELYGSQRRSLDSARPFDALLVGVAQAIALIPGVSRSGITISAAMFDGFRREEAAVFAFLLSAPIIAAAGSKQFFDLARGEGGDTTAGLEVYVVGLVAAAIVGYAAVAFLIKFLRGNPLYAFVAYRVALGIVVLGLVAAGVL